MASGVQYDITGSNAGYGPLFTRQDVTNQSPREMRLVHQATYQGRPGVMGGDDFKVSLSGSANMILNVKPGTAYIAGSNSLQGYYAQVLPVQASITIAGNTSGSTRTDYIYLCVNDRDNSGSGSETSVIWVNEGSTITTMTSTYKAYILLATIAIPTGTTTSLVGRTVTDQRTFASSGSIIPATSSTRPTAGSTYPLPSPFSGLGVYETNTQQLRFYDGANWVPLGIKFANYQNTMYGAGPGVTSQMLIQAGTTVDTTDAGANISITYPSAFPNALVTVVATNGDAATNEYVAVFNGFRLNGFQAHFSTAFVSRRCNWIAIGW